MNYLSLGLLSFTMMSSVSFASGDHHHHHDHGAKEEQNTQEMNHDMHKEMGHDMMKDMDHSHGHHDGMAHGPSMVGKAGLAEKVTKVIKVEATDQMRFIYEPFEAKAGETIKFLVTNTGKIMHEFAVGTKEEHMAHGKMMMANPNMEHGPSSGVITIEPGKTKSLIWQFSQAMPAQFACNEPGHYQAGMYTDIKITQ